MLYISGIAVLQGKLYILGGCIGQNTVSTCETLDLNTFQWQSMPAMRIREYLYRKMWILIEVV